MHRLTAVLGTPAVAGKGARLPLWSVAQPSASPWVRDGSLVVSENEDWAASIKGHPQLRPIGQSTGCVRRRLPTLDVLEVRRNGGPPVSSLIRGPPIDTGTTVVDGNGQFSVLDYFRELRSAQPDSGHFVLQARWVEEPLGPAPPQEASRLLTSWPTPSFTHGEMMTRPHGAASELRPNTPRFVRFGSPDRLATVRSSTCQLRERCVGSAGAAR